MAHPDAMGASGAPPKAAPWQHFAAFVRSVPAVPRTACLAVLVCGVATIATWQGQWLRPGTGVWTPAAKPVAAAAVPAVARPRSRCDTCAVVQSIRRLDTAAGAPESHELVLLLRDGSTHVSTSISAARWQVGDRVLLIGADSHED